MNGKSYLILILSLGILFSHPLAAEKPDKKLGPALKSIQGMDAYNFVKTLASREFRGRLTGDEGYTAAAKWAAGKFRAWGLRPVSAKEGFLLAYPSPFTLIDRSEMALLLPKENANPQKPGKDSFEEIKLEPEKDYLPLLFSDSGRAAAELVFAGWGISAPDLGYDDYAGLDIKGKFVLCFRGTPDETEKRFQYHKTLRQTGEIRDIGVRSSDFAPFFLKGANCAAFFSNGPHLAYHKTGDTIYRINPDIMADIARLAFLSAYAWADR